jgi:RHS repeat-associated protein
VAEREGTTLRYLHQDSLSSTSLVTNASGNFDGALVSHYPFGLTRSGSVPVDEQFTGQKLDSTGLYYYNARYYDPEIGRFISADSIGQSLPNPQSLNRYTYVFNNPLKYTNPTGHFGFLAIFAVIRIAVAVYNVVTTAHDIIKAIQDPTPMNIISAAAGIFDPTPGNKAEKPPLL